MKKSELRKIIREEISVIMEAVKFTVTVDQTVGSYAQSQGAKGKNLSKKSFDTEKEAIAHRKQMIKKYKLTRQRGFWGNAKTGIELTTNF